MLCTAIVEGDIDECRRLLTEGADPNEKSKFRIPVLAIAVTLDQPKCTQALLQAAADPNILDAKATTVLSSACDAGRTECVSALLDASANIGLVSGPERRTALHNSCRNGRSLQCLPLLLAAGSGLDAGILDLTDGSGATALGLAARNGHADAVRRLLTARADATLRWRSDDALALARQSENEQCVKLLLREAEARRE